MASASPLQLLNTSWTAHRLSPLHHEKEFPTLLHNPVALNTYASRLRDQLTGNILAGLQGPVAAAEDDSLSKTGALKTCSWEMLSSWSQLTDHDAVSQSSAGILVTLEYEHIVYKAALLADAQQQQQQQQQQRQSPTPLPLLLTRLPNPLRQTFISFLSANFDTHCSVLRLPQAFLCFALEVYFTPFISSSPETSDGDDQNLETLADIVKEMQLTLSFSSSVSPNLKSLNISIPSSSFHTFLTSSSSQPMHSPNTPFLANLSSYLDRHLAMNLDLGNASAHTLARQHVRLSRVSCGAFGIGCEGRLKLVASKEIAGSGGSGEERSETDKMVLRASVALLQAVIRRATPGHGQGG